MNKKTVTSSGKFTKHTVQKYASYSLSMDNLVNEQVTLMNQLILVNQNK